MNLKSERERDVFKETRRKIKKRSKFQLFAMEIT